jgi:ribokinase
MMPQQPSAGILVVGSLNLDIVMRVPRMPEPGETLASEQSAVHCGGKGANQAVACARLGAPVSMIGLAGTDAAGQTLRDQLELEGVDCENVGRTPAGPSGIAVVMVTANGENRITLAPGANALLTPDHIQSAATAFQRAKLLLCQLETPMETVESAVAHAKRAGVTVILNAAPAPALPLAAALLGTLDYLVVNEIEATSLTGIAVHNVEDARRAARWLRDEGARHVIVTLGASGAVVMAPDQDFHVPAMATPVVDTTAAGDTFIGGLAVGLMEGRSLSEAVSVGINAAAICVSRAGAQSSMPLRREVSLLAASDDATDR